MLFRSIQEEYAKMEDEYDFITVDATQPPDIQQMQIRQVVESRLSLSQLRWRTPAYLIPQDSDV